MGKKVEKVDRKNTQNERIEWFKKSMNKQNGFKNKKYYKKWKWWRNVSNPVRNKENIFFLFRKKDYQQLY